MSQLAIACSVRFLISADNQKVAQLLDLFRNLIVAMPAPASLIIDIGLGFDSCHDL